MSAATIPVLLYHSVSDRPPPDGSWGAVSPSLFAAHLAVIIERGSHAITVSELALALRRHRPLPERPVVITFDDGYEDTPSAVEVLAALGLSATVYVTTGALDAPGRLSRAEVNALSRSEAVELGAHGVGHPHLDELPWSSAARELTVSKTVLETLTGDRVDSFAYPHGAFDRAVRDAAIAAGYRSAVAVKNAVSHLDDDPFAIARFTVTARVSARRLAEVLDGRRVRRASPRERVRTRAGRAVRRRRSGRSPAARRLP